MINNTYELRTKTRFAVGVNTVLKYAGPHA